MYEKRSGKQNQKVKKHLKDSDGKGLACKALRSTLLNRQHGIKVPWKR